MTTMEDAAAYEVLEELTTPRPIAEYHEDMGSVLWWKFPIEEPPYVGSPLNCGFTVEIEQIVRQHQKQKKTMMREQVGGWPGYHTHFTMLPKVKAP